MTTLPPFVAATAFTALILGSASAQKDCDRTRAFLTPLSDLVGGSYRGEPGGLYAADGNDLPAGHRSDGLLQAASILPRDAAGNPAADGRIGFLSIGMSNTTQEFSTWQGFGRIDPQRAAAVTIVDGAQGGQDARIFANPNANAWSVVDQRLANSGLSGPQVQVVWLKQAMSNPTTTTWPAHVDELRSALGDVVRNLRTRFPNCRICFLTSRSYGNYSLRAERNEPLSYETGFAVRDLILDQIAGDPMLGFDAPGGPPQAPWLAWGPYIWADGVAPRSDGVTWPCNHYQADGIHPAGAGRLQVADLLQDFLEAHRGDLTGWYFAAVPDPASAAVLPYGEICAGSTQPSTRSSSVPRVGALDYRIGIQSAPPNASASLFLALGRASVPLAADRCWFWLDPALVIDALATTTDASGRRLLGFAVPNDTGLVGARLFTQWGVLDAAAPPIRGLGGVAWSQGLLHQIGR